MTKDNASGAGEHTAIMALRPATTEDGQPMGWSADYLAGFRDARVEAAKIALGATRLLAESQAHNAKLEAQVERLEAVIRRLMRSFPTDSDMAEAGWEP